MGPQTKASERASGRAVIGGFFAFIDFVVAPSGTTVQSRSRRSNYHYLYNVLSLGNKQAKYSLSLILTYNKEYKLVKNEFKETIVYNTALSYFEADNIIANIPKHDISELHKFTKNKLEQVVIVLVRPHIAKPF